MKAEQIHSISEKFLNSDLYLCYSEDKQTGTIIPFGIYQEASLKKEIEALGEYNFQPKSLKLTEQEKELYIASSLAHETKQNLVNYCNSINDYYVYFNSRNCTNAT